MRPAILIMFSLFVVRIHAQDIQPKIVGQKELSTEQGTALTIHLTDLFVEEIPVQTGEDSNNGGGGGHNDDDNSDNGGENDNGGSDNDGNHGGGGSGDDDDRDDEDDEKDGDDDGKDDDDEKGHENDKGDKEDEGNKDDKNDKNDKGNKGGENDKGNKGSKGQGSNEDSGYPDGYTLIVLEGTDYTVTGTTILPDAGFTGLLKVPVRVRNVKYASAIFTMRITVVPAGSPENVAPQITGQLPLSISVNQSVKIMLSQLLITDPDNEYPADFTVKVFPGTNYSVDGTTVVPQQGFTGDLTVNVSVSDGIADSQIFPFKITVTPGVNIKPVITGQTGLKIPQGESLEIKLTHLAVDDPDNRYPDDFTLVISSGDNYTVSNHTVTPHPTFLGTLTVRVSVHDGKAASDAFDLKIQVISRDKLEIVGQKAITVPEDSSVVISFSDLIVNDPSNSYPDGFTIDISAGQFYEVSRNRILPTRDFSGNLTIPVTIRQGAATSDPFQLLIIVEPVNDAPELINVPSEPIVVNGRGTWPLFPGAEVVDVDDDYLLFAEIGFRDRVLPVGQDKISFTPAGNLHAVFDEPTGMLYVVGRGSLTEYQQLIQSVTYDFDGSPDSLLANAGYIYAELNDGKTTSAQYERVLMFDNEVELDIPSAFTPNNDNANDTWEITPLQHAEQLNTFIRVYDKNGNMVFEANDLQQAWDGHFNGSPLPADVYFYTIEMDLSYRKVSYKGIVSILR